MEVKVGDWFCHTLEMNKKNMYCRANHIDQRYWVLLRFRDGSGDYNDKSSVKYFFDKWTYVRNFELMDILYGEE